jgi:hypothetical protein
MATRREAAAGGLGPELVDLLLAGRGAPSPVEPHPDAFDIFALSDADLRTAWRTHRLALLKEAGRRGLGRPIWAETAFDIPGWPRDLDFALAHSALHGAPLPSWATHTAADLTVLRQRLLAILSDAPET